MIISIPSSALFCWILPRELALHSRISKEFQTKILDWVKTFGMAPVFSRIPTSLMTRREQRLWVALEHSHVPPSVLRVYDLFHTVLNRVVGMRNSLRRIEKAPIREVQTFSNFKNALTYIEESTPILKEHSCVFERSLWLECLKAVSQGYNRDTGAVDEVQREEGLDRLRFCLYERRSGSQADDFRSRAIDFSYGVQHWKALELLLDSMDFSEFRYFINGRVESLRDRDELLWFVNYILSTRDSENADCDMNVILRQVIARNWTQGAAALLANYNFSYENLRVIYRNQRISNEMSLALHEQGTTLARNSRKPIHNALLGIVAAFCVSSVALYALSFYSIFRRIPNNLASLSIVRRYLQLNHLVQWGLVVLALVLYKITKKIVPLWPPPSIE